MATKARRLKPPRIDLNKKVFVIGGGVLVLFLLTLLIFLIFGSPSVAIPKEVTQKAKSNIYLPSRMPGTYKIDESSFSMVEDNTVLLFSAKDSVNGDLIFSEQARPKDFDFENFHKGKFESPETLSDVPYPSVWGKTIDSRVALSIVTDDTWILMVTSASLTKDDMVRIAANMQKR